MVEDGAGRTAVVVVGGGIAGLVIARDLARAGVDVTLLEARPVLGGCVGVHEVDGMRLDAGADSFALRNPALAELAAELGLDDQVVTPSDAPTWSVTGGDVGSAVAVPLPEAGPLGIPAALGADLRRAVGLLGLLRARADRWLPARVGTRGAAGARPDVAHLVRRRLGRRVLERLVAPVVSGVRGARPEELEVEPWLLDAVREHGSLTGAVAALTAGRTGPGLGGLTGGVHRIVEALAADAVAHGAIVRTDAEVLGLSAGPGPDPRWLVTTDGGRWSARHVVLAVPGRPAALLLQPVVGESSIPSTHAADVVVVTAVLDTGSGAGPGSGSTSASGAGPADRAIASTTGRTAAASVLAPPGPGRDDALNLVHGSARWPWLADAEPTRAVLRVSYGRAGRRPDVPESGPALTARALADIAALRGEPIDAARVIGTDVSEWPAALPLPVPGQAAQTARLREALDARPGLHVTGAWVTGSGLAAVVPPARELARGIASDLAR